MNRETSGNRIQDHRRWLLLMAVPVILGATPLCGAAAVVEGMLLTKGGPVQGGTVRAYRSLSETWGGTPLASSTPGTKPGSYRMELPPGKYYFTASGAVSGREYSAFHGGNPLAVDATKENRVSFMLNPVTSAAVKGAEKTRLTGTVTFRGHPVADAQVALYLPASGVFKGRGFMSGTTTADGSFSLTVASGDYLVVARKRFSDKGGMRLGKGDLFCYFPGNPVRAKEVTETSIEIPCYPSSDVNAFLDEGVQVKQKEAGRGAMGNDSTR